MSERTEGGREASESRIIENVLQKKLFVSNTGTITFE